MNADQLTSALTSFGVDPGTVTNVQAAVSGGAATPAQGCAAGALFNTATGQPCPAASSSSSPSFTRDLTLGSTGPDVLALQRYLNANGFTVSVVGAGSPGNETTTFGPATRAALSRFQTSRGITPAAGYFGPKTRAFIQ